MREKITEEIYKVRYYELTKDWKASITTIMDYFNDVVTLQSVEIGDDVQAMRYSGFAWLLLRWEIDINRMPAFMESVKVRTIPYSMNKFYAYRRFEAIAESGEALVRAKTQWILLDVERRKPVRMKDRHYTAYGLSKEFDRPLQFEEIREFEAASNSSSFEVAKRDLDTNGHANNVSYVRWLLESVPEEIDDLELKKLSVRYLNEAKRNEKMHVECAFKVEGETTVGFHRVLSQEKTFVVASTEWL